MWQPNAHSMQAPLQPERHGGRAAVSRNMSEGMDSTLERDVTTDPARATGSQTTPPRHALPRRRAADKRSEEPIVAELGSRVRALRQQCGLTLDQLAALSGVSRAMLSNVERGEKSPTLAVIARIARGLDISVSALLGAEGDPHDVVLIRSKQRSTFVDPETGFERQLLSPSHVNSNVEIVFHRIPAGKSSGEILPYKFSVEKYLVVNEGWLTVYIGDKCYRLNEGDAMYFEVNAPYRFANEGKDTCGYYVVIVRKP